MSRRCCRTLVSVVVAMTAALTGCSGGGTDPVTFPTASGPPSPSGGLPASAPSAGAPTAVKPLPDRQVIATGLPVPWALAFLPDTSVLVTLREQAEVLHISNGSAPASVGRVPGVQPAGEGGLLGIAVSPAFASDHAVFVYFTSGDDNRVMRMTFDGSALKPGPVIVSGIAKAGNHNGGRLAFGPDKYLYISTGDAAQGDSAQDKGSLNGKILRVNSNGAPAPGNPFPGSRVWSLGHRNVQGMAWDGAGTMYASEFGQNTWDELNHIQPGRNYGWPVVEGIGRRAGFVDPVRQWSTADASPSGIAVGLDGALYMAALRGESLWRIPLTGKGKTGEPQRLLQGRYGRLRAVASGPTGLLWVVTNNTSRGAPRPGDDQIIAFHLPVKDG